MVLGEFLKEIKKNPSSVKFAEMANILVIHCQTTGECVEARGHCHLLGSSFLSHCLRKSPGGSVNLCTTGSQSSGAVGPCEERSGFSVMEALSLGLTLEGSKIWRLLVASSALEL